MSVRDWEEAYKIAARVLTGESQAAIVWDGTIREKFVQWMRANSYSKDYISECVIYLNKYVDKIGDPEDVVEIFQACSRGRHHLDRAIRALLNYYQAVEGIPEEQIERLKKAIPKTGTGIDLREVSENQIIETLRILKEAPQSLKKYYALWMVMLDSGVRLNHAIQFINTFNPNLALNLNNFIRYPLGIERETKHTWYVYMRLSTLQLVSETAGAEVTRAGVNKLMRKMRAEGKTLVSPKLVRKFTFNKMLQLGVPESIADFICGRKPRSVGARHYTWLIQQADSHYPKYADYLNLLLSRL